VSKWGEAASRVDIEVFPKRKLPLGAEKIVQSMYNKRAFNACFSTERNSLMSVLTSSTVSLLSWIILTESSLLIA